MSVGKRRLEQSLEEELAKLDPATLEYFEQLLAENAPVARSIIQNVLEEPIPEETQKSLQKPLLPKPFNSPPKRDRGRGKTTMKIVDQFTGKIYKEENNREVEIDNLLDDTEVEAEEKKGRRYIRWRFIKVLNENLTPKIMAKIRERVKTFFYLRHVFSYRLVHVETGDIMVYFTNPKGSQWVTKLEDAEKWLNEREEE